jgi:ligand-binding sensor domain-containing protein
MKQILFMSFIVIFITSCDGQNKKTDNDTAVEIKKAAAFKASLVNDWPGLHVWTITRPSSYIPRSHVRSMIQDRSGNVWIGTYTGLFRYDAINAGGPCNKNTCQHDLTKPNDYTEHFRRISRSFLNVTESDGYIDLPVFSVYEDVNGSIWFGTADRGVGCFNGKRCTFYTIQNGLADNYVYSIVQDKNGVMWFGTKNGLSKFDGQRFTNYTSKEGLPGSTIYTMVKDRGIIWIGTDAGVCSFDGTIFKKLQGNNMDFRNVRSLFIDKNQTLWIGHPSGLSSFDGKKFLNFNNELNSHFVYCISEDKDGMLWFGLSDEEGNGKGISRFDGNQFRRFTQKDGLLNNRVMSLFTDKDGLIWLGTALGPAFYDGNTFTDFYEKGRDGC